MLQARNIAAANNPEGIPSDAEIQSQLGVSQTPLTPQQEMDARANRIDPTFDQQANTFNQGVPGFTMDQAQTAPRANTPYKTPFTVGDALQGVSVLSKFVQGFQPSEVEPQRSIATPITQETYDPTNILYNNQRQYSNLLNRNYGSAPIRRAVANQALATKMSADQNVLAQYAQLNQQANQRYQGRLEQRRGQNIQLEQYTRDLNARNRAARRTGIDNAFNSLSNFGVGLNAKTQAADQVNLLSNVYPDIANRALASLTQEDLLKLFRR